MTSENLQIKPPYDPFNYDKKLMLFLVIGMGINISFACFSCVMHLLKASVLNEILRSIDQLHRGNERFLNIQDRVKSELYQNLADIKTGIIDLKTRPAQITPVAVPVQLQPPAEKPPEKPPALKPAEKKP